MNELNTINIQPLISIIVVLHKNTENCEQILQSILQQSYMRLECVIMANDVNQQTINIINQYEQQFVAKSMQYKVMLGSNHNAGLAEIMNQGIRIATGELLTIISDNMWYELDTMALVAAAYNKDSSNDLFYGMVKFYDNDALVYADAIGEHDLWRRTMYHCGVVYKKQLHEICGYYSTKYKKASDYDFLLKCYLHKCKFSLIEKIVINHRLRNRIAQARFPAPYEDIKVQLDNKLINNKQYVVLNILAFCFKLLAIKY